MLSLGVLLISNNKRLRAIEDLQTMAAGKDMCFADYRSATSFLQHLRPFVLGVNASLLYGMYGPFKRDTHGMLPSAATVVHMTDAISEQAVRWVILLQTTGGMFFSALLQPQPPSAATPRLHLFSDAALAGAGNPGLEGYMEGFFWALKLTSDALRLLVAPTPRSPLIIPFATPQI